MASSGETQLYRHFNESGELLYVGISLSTVSRLAQHRNASHWFAEIASITVETFPTRIGALEAERKAILEENPIHNLKRPTRTDVNRATLAADESKADLVRRLVQFNPMYTPTEAASALGLGLTAVKRLIEENEIGHVCVGEIKQRGKTFKVYRITGWQLIEYIEHLQGGTD